MDYLNRLQAAIDARQHKPIIRVSVGGQLVDAESGSYDCGFEENGAAVSTGTVSLPTIPDWLQFKQALKIEAGYDGLYCDAYRGYIVDDGREHSPVKNQITAMGYLHLTQYQSDQELTFASQTDIAIINALLAYCGVGNRDIQGIGWTLGVTRPIVLREGDTPFDLIGRIGQLTGYRYFDNPADGRVLGRRVTGQPSATAAWSLIDGVNTFSVSRPRTIRTIHNKVVVYGSPAITPQPYAARRADNPLNPSTHDVVYKVGPSEYIEDNTVAMAVAVRELTDKNSLVEEITVETWGNPRYRIGDTVALTSPKLKVSTPVNCFLKRHHFSWPPMRSRLTLERRVGSAGYDLGFPPEPAITYKITSQTFADGITRYTLICDASGTTDPDTPIGGLTFLWSNDGGKVGTVTDGVVYTLKLEEADFPIEITLTVSDGTNVAHAHQEVTLEGTFVQARNLYLAKATSAEATEDCGATWGSDAIAATCLSEIAGENLEFFGAGTVLKYTDDYLATPAQDVHTFPAAITAVSLSEVNAALVTVGLVNGDVWESSNATDIAASTWTKRWTFGAAVNWVWRDFGGQVWVLMGAQLIVDGTVLADLGETALRLALSGFGNYFGGGGTVKHQDGVPCTFPGPVTGIKGLCHHIRDDILFAGDSDAAGSVYKTNPGSNMFTKVGETSSPINHMIRDGDFEDVLYAACEDGLYKSDDGGVTWGLLRAGRCLMVGYGSAPWTEITPLTLVTDVSWKVLPHGTNSTEPANWRDVGFDDSGWDAAATVAPGAGDVPGATSIWYLGALATRGEIPVTAEAGTTISGLVVGHEYAVEGTGDGWDPGIEWPAGIKSFHLSNDGGATWHTPAAAPWVSSFETLGSGHFRAYWTATTASVKIRVADEAGAFGDNTGSMGWCLSRKCLCRKEFTLSEGIVNQATLTIEHDDWCDGVWINNVLVYQSPATHHFAGDPAVVTIDPTLFIPGTDNCIAIQGHTGGYYPTEIAWVQAKLEVS